MSQETGQAWKWFDASLQKSRNHWHQQPRSGNMAECHRLDRGQPSQREADQCHLMMPGEVQPAQVEATEMDQHSRLVLGWDKIWEVIEVQILDAQHHWRKIAGHGQLTRGWESDLMTLKAE